MAIVDVLGGGIDKKVIEFDPKMERFCTGLISLSSYPFSEITKANIISEHGKFVVVDVSFGESLNIHVRLKVDQYKSLCQCRDRYQEEPTGVELPIREISAIPWVWGAVVVLFVIIGLSNSETSNAPVLNSVVKTDVCKAAIQYLSSMSGDRNEVIDQGRTVRINQTRASDGKRFYYDCKIQGNTIIWRMNQADGRMGRWRNSAYDPQVTYSVINGRIVIQEN